MNWNKFSHQFHKSWHNKIKPFIESDECNKIYSVLKKESKRGAKIAPLSFNTFRAFKLTNLDNLKVVIIGLCPYHSYYYGNPIADGLCMGCSITNKLQPTLEKFYEGIEIEMHDGLNLNYIKDPDVSYLAKQGVLMLNAALTTEKMKAGNHLSIWEPFMKYLFEEIINVSGVPVIYLGKEASKLRKYRGIFTHDFFLSHPASAAYNMTSWDTKGTFTKVNKLLKETNNFEIKWLNDMPF